MKIGILTQPLHWNYGGILQHWALQQVVRSMGHEPIKLERVLPIRLDYALTEPLRIAKTAVWKLLGRRRDVSLRRMAEIYYLNFHRMPVKELKLTISGRLTDTEALKSAADGLDAFLVGSDQVWRQEYSPCIGNFFLDFLSESDGRRRVAYAASFGKRAGYISPDQMDHCQRHMARFDAVSVREREGLDILTDDFGLKGAQQVLDPTLLLSADDYREILPQRKNSLPRHITAYILDSTRAKEALIDSLSGSLGVRAERMGVRGETVRGYATPRVGRWLQSIATSEMVVTDSFHGTVFAILFHRPFIAIGNISRGLDRFRSLLEPLGLADRLVIPGEDGGGILTNVGCRAIDWEEVDRRLDPLRAASLDFLRHALEDHPTQISDCHSKQRIAN